MVWQSPGRFLVRGNLRSQSTFIQGTFQAICTVAVYYSWTKYYLAEFVAMAADKATTMGHIKRDALENARVLIPCPDDYLKIEEQLQPLYDAIIAHRVEIRKLSTLRNTLLPRLMSGEIDVSNITL